MSPIGSISYGAGRRMEFATSTPDMIAEAMVAALKRADPFKPVEADGAARRRPHAGRADLNRQDLPMIEDPRGRIDYEESGDGPTVVLVPGSCATGAAWRPVIAAWDGAFRSVTTSLLGYGGTAERRTNEDASMAHEADIVEAVVRRAGGKVHLVGHSYGAAAALALALRDRNGLASLSLVEMPAPQLLRDLGEDDHYQTFQRMTDVYKADFAAGKPDAIARMIDFYGGPGTFSHGRNGCATTRPAPPR